MRSKVLLRTAAIVMLLHTIGHTIGALTWKQAPNSPIAQVITGMENNHFQFMGRQTSLADFHEGYGLIMIAVLMFVSILLYVLSSAKNSGVIMLTGIFLIILAIAEYIYFFPFAAAFSFLAGVCTLVSLSKNVDRLSVS